MPQLKDLMIKHLPTPAKSNKVHYDDEVKGFGVGVTAAGARSFVLNYVTRSGRERRYTIGSCQDWSTTAARAEARRLRQLIDQGGDPLADIEAEREAPTVGDLIGPVRSRAPSAPTREQCGRLQTYARQTCAAAFWQAYESRGRVLRRHRRVASQDN